MIGYLQTLGNAVGINPETPQVVLRVGYDPNRSRIKIAFDKFREGLYIGNVFQRESIDIARTFNLPDFDKYAQFGGKIAPNMNNPRGVIVTIPGYDGTLAGIPLNWALSRPVDIADPSGFWRLGGDITIQRAPNGHKGGHFQIPKLEILLYNQ